MDSSASLCGFIYRGVYQLICCVVMADAMGLVVRALSGDMSAKVMSMAERIFVRRDVAISLG